MVLTDYDVQVLKALPAMVRAELQPVMKKIAYLKDDLKYLFVMSGTNAAVIALYQKIMDEYPEVKSIPLEKWWSLSWAFIIPLLLAFLIRVANDIGRQSRVTMTDIESKAHATISSFSGLVIPQDTEQQKLFATMQVLLYEWMYDTLRAIKYYLQTPQRELKQWLKTHVLEEKFMLFDADSLQRLQTLKTYLQTAWIDTLQYEFFLEKIMNMQRDQNQLVYDKSILNDLLGNIRILISALITMKALPDTAQSGRAIRNIEDFWMLLYRVMDLKSRAEMVGQRESIEFVMKWYGALIPVLMMNLWIVWALITWLLFNAMVGLLWKIALAAAAPFDLPAWSKDRIDPQEYLGELFTMLEDLKQRAKSFENQNFL